MLTEREIVQKIREHPKEPGLLRYSLSEPAAATLIKEHTLKKMKIGLDKVFHKIFPGEKG